MGVVEMNDYQYYEKKMRSKYDKFKRKYNKLVVYETGTDEINLNYNLYKLNLLYTLVDLNVDLETFILIRRSDTYDESIEKYRFLARLDKLLLKHKLYYTELI